MINIFKHLLPRARAWNITIDKSLRRLILGLASLPADIREYFDLIFTDIDPARTRTLESWEFQFALPGANISEEERRARLDAAWKALGGQSPGYIQNTLRAAGFDVYIHEWWDGVLTRSPFTYLDDGTGGLPYIMGDGTEDAQDGGAQAMDGATENPAGYPLVNKIPLTYNRYICDGAPKMLDGGDNAMDGLVIIFRTRKQYIMPPDADTYPHYIYIGAASFPDKAEVPENRRDEFEDLCLKICPTGKWLGILVNYI